MAGFNLEQAVCTGRGFDVAGLGGKLKAFAVKPPLALGGGGPGWYLHDDQSAISPNPYIIISDKNAAGANTPAKYIQFVIPTATSGRVEIYYYLYWDPVNHIGRGMYGAHTLPTLDAADFIYDFRGGPECFFIQTFTVSNWDGTWIDEITPDPNLIDSVDATTVVTNYSDNGNIQFRGIDLTSSSAANALDVNGNMYLSVILVSGSTYRVDMFKSSARGAGDLVWRSGNFTGLTLGNATSVTGTSQNGSGVGFTVYLQGPTVADATIVFRFNKITVGVGEGAQFVVDNYYMAYDLTVRNSVNSFKVISKSGDELTIDRLYRPFTTGTKIGNLHHNYFVGGTSTTLWLQKSAIPYFNVLGTMAIYSNGVNGSLEQSELTRLTLSTNWNSNAWYGPHAFPSTDDNYITRLSPDRKGRWAVQRPGIVERKSFGYPETGTVEGRTGYGQLKNVIVGAATGMSSNIHGRSLNGIDYTYFRLMNDYSYQATGWAAMFRETQSAV